jgi:hypothetical protein
MVIKKISEEEYNSFEPARGPSASETGEELEWYTTASQNEIGMVVRDKIDDDYLYVVQGPDQSAEFRAIDLEGSIPDRDKAREKLFSSLTKFEKSGDTVFPQ